MFYDNGKAVSGISRGMGPEIARGALLSMKPRRVAIPLENVRRSRPATALVDTKERLTLLRFSSLFGAEPVLSDGSTRGGGDGARHKNRRQTS
jgi:hypothetical protein